jgi:hypothetical protein
MRIAEDLRLQVVPNSCQSVRTSKLCGMRFDSLNVACLDHALPCESSLVPILKIDDVSLLHLQSNICLHEATYR